MWIIKTFVPKMDHWYSYKMYPSQSRSSRNACCPLSRKPWWPCCRGAGPPPASRQTHSGRRSGAAQPSPYRAAGRGEGLKVKTRAQGASLSLFHALPPLLYHHHHHHHTVSANHFLVLANEILWLWLWGAYRAWVKAEADEQQDLGHQDGKGQVGMDVVALVTDSAHWPARPNTNRNIEYYKKCIT